MSQSHSFDVALDDAPLTIVADTEPTIDLRSVKPGQIDLTEDASPSWNTSPLTVHPEQPVADARDLMDRFAISGVPVVDNLGRLVGLLTRRDLRFRSRAADSELVRSVMTRTLVTVPSGTSLDEARAVLHANRIERVPMIDEHQRLVALVSASDFDRVDDAADNSDHRDVTLDITAGTAAAGRTPHPCRQ